MKTLHLLFIAPFFACTALVAQPVAPPVAPTSPAPEKAPAPAVQADPAVVEAALKALKFDDFMSKALDQQKQMVKQVIQQMIMRARLPGTPKEDVKALEQKALDTVNDGLSIAEIHAVAVRNYGETFTTDELRVITDFYNSPAGQAYAVKRSEAEQKIGATLRPRVMEAMQKIQQMTRDFVAQQQAKAAAAAAAAKPSAPAKP
jgi:hypothetical protein